MASSGKTESVNLCFRLFAVLGLWEKCQITVISVVCGPKALCVPHKLNCWPIYVLPKLHNWHWQLKKAKQCCSVGCNFVHRNCFSVSKLTRYDIKNNLILFSLRSVRKIALNRRGKMHQRDFKDFNINRYINIKCKTLSVKSLEWGISGTVRWFKWFHEVHPYVPGHLDTLRVGEKLQKALLRFQTTMFSPWNAVCL